MHNSFRLGTDSLNVARTIGRLLDDGSLSTLLPLVKDGDPGSNCSAHAHTIRVTKVKRHAAEAAVDQGRVRLEERLGNIEADAAVDLERRHQDEGILDAHCVLLNARDFWYSIMWQLRRFKVAISGVSVNHDGGGGTA